MLTSACIVGVGMAFDCLRLVFLFQVGLLRLELQPYIKQLAICNRFASCMACCPFVIVLLSSLPTFGAALLVSVNLGAYKKSPATPLGSCAARGQRPLFYVAGQEYVTCKMVDVSLVAQFQMG